MHGDAGRVPCQSAHARRHPVCGEGRVQGGTVRSLLRDAGAAVVHVRHRAGCLHEVSGSLVVCRGLSTLRIADLFTFCYRAPRVQLAWMTSRWNIFPLNALILNHPGHTSPELGAGGSGVVCGRLGASAVDRAYQSGVVYGCCVFRAGDQYHEVDGKGPASVISDVLLVREDPHCGRRVLLHQTQDLPTPVVPRQSYH